MSLDTAYPCLGGCNISEIKDPQILQSRAAQLVTLSPPRSNRKAELVDSKTVNQLPHFVDGVQGEAEQGA